MGKQKQRLDKMQRLKKKAYGGIVFSAKEGKFLETKGKSVGMPTEEINTMRVSPLSNKQLLAFKQEMSRRTDKKETE